MFEFILLGVVLVVVGMVYLMLIGCWLLLWYIDIDMLVEVEIGKYVIELEVIE